MPAKAQTDPVIDMVDAMRAANKAITDAQAAHKRARRLAPDREMARKLREIQTLITDVTVTALVNS